MKSAYNTTHLVNQSNDIQLSIICRENYCSQIYKYCKVVHRYKMLPYGNRRTKVGNSKI